MKPAAAWVLMAASGFAALGYQVVWTQQAALWLGHEGAAVLAVLTAFFGGLALGAATLGRRIERSVHAARWYAACELAIAAWALGLAALLQPAAVLVLQAIGPEPSPLRHWGLAFGATFALLLPATLAMGATLPALERAVAALLRRPSAVAAAYAANTLGGIAGVLGAAFWLVPQYGLAATAALCAASNAACALMALRVFPRAVAPAAQASGALPRRLEWILAATGFLGMAFEMLVMRVVAQVTESTVYTYAILLALYLAGTSLGAAFHHRALGRFAAKAVQDTLVIAVALAAIAGAAVLGAAPALQATIAAGHGPTWPRALLGEALLSALAFLPATFCMGALFAHLATRCRDEGLGLARALAVNALAAATAPAIVALALIPLLGLKVALLACALAYLALLAPAAWRRWPAWFPVAAATVAFAVVPSLAIVRIPEGGRLLRQATGPIATVSIVADGSGITTLHIDNHQQEGSSATRFADARQAWLPMLLHPAPRRALFLGLGTGVTSAAAAEDAGLAVDAVELLPEVIALSHHFTGDTGFAARRRMVAADARRFVRASPDRYDLIVADNFHPARSGSGALYTVEHFRAVRERLAQGGLFCQWLPLHQLDLPTLRIIVASFLEANPGAYAILATYSLETPTVGLVARRDGGPWNADALRVRLADARVTAWAAEAGFDTEIAVLGTFVADANALAAFSGGAPLNTDDRPLVAYRAPMATYQPESRPRERLMSVLAEWHVAPEALLTAPVAPSMRARLAAYMSARDRFLVAGTRVQPTADPARMLAQVRGPLLEVLRASADFRPAREPLVRIADALAIRDPAGARALLAELAALPPAGVTPPKAVLAGMPR